MQEKKIICRYDTQDTVAGYGPCEEDKCKSTDRKNCMLEKMPGFLALY